jgi:hypothetical protein
MISDDVSPKVRLLTYLVIQTMIEKIKRGLHIPIKFRQITRRLVKETPGINMTIQT